MTDPAPPALATVGTTEIAPPPELALPERIGRYRVEGVLGQGGFGLVYLARDEELQRPVAIKVPHRKLVARPEDAAAYLTEARTVANLDHSHIVPVHDVGSTPEFPCFVVSKYIDGTDLAKQIAQSRPALRETVEVVATVAEALHYAHKQGLVHRDVKPGNILLDRSGKPFITDFGIALREQDVGKSHGFAGTPAYMSPEQARGEGHRVDGRSDIFSLGVTLYELLTNRSPFRAETLDALVQEITNTDPRPPRMIDDTIPKELERICLKAMSRRATERYTTARDLADDLRYFLSESPSLANTPIHSLPLTASQKLSDTAESAASPLATTPPLTDRQPLKIVPKGLRSFDANDADFFLELLPGPRDRDGLPDSIRFWKTRIESTNPDSTFAVGLIYGPSGCGKSSLVKAGLLPRLSRSIKTVYIEATGDDTELRLIKGLRRQLPELPSDLALVDTLAALRRGRHLERDEKVLLVLDQSEQWLHSHRHEALTELVQALRHCDGVRLQAIVMVRDDFWMAATRFMSELEIRLVEGQNSAAADLFPVRHAEKVLALFGRAYGELPPNPAQDTKEQQQFVQAAVGGLAQDGKVICVRVALFADMVKGKPWTPATLKAIGGTEGVGVTFLEETFAAKTAPPQHRLHQQAAQAVLKSLLPEAGTDIKGHMRSQQELLEASGYASRHRDFDELLRILDSELRLITPTDPAGQDASSEPGDVSPRSPETRYYQLTHDYLVPSLRDWLTRKQKETRRGRAELLLAERTAMWQAKPEARQLPSVLQWLQIRWLTPSKNWSLAQRKLMSKAGRHHAVRSAAVGVFLAIATVAGLAIRDRVDQQKRATHAAGLVQALLKADTAQVPTIVAELGEYRLWTDPLLKAEFDKAAADSPQKLHTSLALLPVDGSQLDYLSQQLPVCSLKQFPILRVALMPHKDQLTVELQPLVTSQHSHRQFQAAAALAAFAPDHEYWTWLGPKAADYLITAIQPVYLREWSELFQPARQHLTGPLIRAHADRSEPTKLREAAAFLLAIFFQDQPDKLADTILIADELAEFSTLVGALQPHAAVVRPKLLSELQMTMPETLAKTYEQLSLEDQQRRDAHWKRQSLAAVALVHLGYANDVWPLLTFTPDPSLRSLIIHHLGKLGTDHNTLAARLALDSDVTIRRALIQSLGGLDATHIPPAERSQIAQQLTELYVHDLDPGIHSSASWTLRQWGIALPDLPTGGPILTREQTERLARRKSEFEEVRQRLVLSEQERPMRQAAWERGLRKEFVSVPPSLSEGLVAHYPLDGAEGSLTANVVADSPGGAYVGPDQPEWVPGVVGRAVRLGGDDGHFECGETFDPERTEAFSGGCWFFVDQDEWRGTLFGTYDQAKQRGFAVSIDPTTSEVLCEWQHQYPENALIVRAAVTELVGRWHHLSVVYDGSSSAAGVTIYLNGRRVDPRVELNTLSDSIQVSKPFQIGRRDTAYAFRGRIDDVRIYDRTLSASEVEQLYASGLRALADVPADVRQVDQQALLETSHRTQDEALTRVQHELANARQASETASPRWFVNSQGQTFAVVSPPEEFGSGPTNYRYAISTHEVTALEFQLMIHGGLHDSDQANSPRDDCPVTAIDWYEAANYCNWLSRQEGISEDQWSYSEFSVRMKNGEMDHEYERMRVRKGELGGYRLPTEAEWEFACRAGTNSKYGFGEPVVLLDEYGYTLRNSEGRMHPVGSRRPNEFGLFDVHGNALEWTQTADSGTASSIAGNIGRVLRGGSFIVQPWYGRSSYRYFEVPTGRNASIGFRLARTLRSDPLTPLTTSTEGGEIEKPKQ